MIGYAVSGLLVLIGTINLIPAAGLLSPERLRVLYGVAPDAPDLILLLRHRALLFALLGGFIVLAAFRPALQPLAFLVALVSMGGFLLLAAGGDHGASIAREVRADVAGLVLLATAFLLHTLRPD